MSRMMHLWLLPRLLHNLRNFCHNWKRFLAGKPWNHELNFISTNTFYHPHFPGIFSFSLFYPSFMVSLKMHSCQFPQHTNAFVSEPVLTYWCSTMHDILDLELKFSIQGEMYHHNHIKFLQQPTNPLPYFKARNG
jgi:hypothetical protein